MHAIDEPRDGRLVGITQYLLSRYDCCGGGVQFELGVQQNRLVHGANDIVPTARVLGSRRRLGVVYMVQPPSKYFMSTFDKTFCKRRLGYSSINLIGRRISVQNNLATLLSTSHTS